MQHPYAHAPKPLAGAHVTHSLLPTPALAREVAPGPVPPARRRYTRYTMRQVSYLRAHYATTDRPALAARLSITLPQLYELARRHGLRSRAANGQVSW